MSAPGEREIVWANGPNIFNIQQLGLVLDLEAKCDAGLAVIMARLEGGAWRVADVRETIRLGLIGGGMDPKAAHAVVLRHVDANPHGYAPSALVAYEVVRQAMFGIPKDDPVGREDGGADQGKKQPAGAQETGSITTTDASDAPK